MIINNSVAIDSIGLMLISVKPILSIGLYFNDSISIIKIQVFSLSKDKLKTDKHLCNLNVRMYFNNAISIIKIMALYEL
jgi:hypothetical protein